MQQRGLALPPPGDQPLGRMGSFACVALEVGLRGLLSQTAFVPAKLPVAGYLRFFEDLQG